MNLELFILRNKSPQTMMPAEPFINRLILLYYHTKIKKSISNNIDFTTLYDYPAGTSSTVNLSDSAANYTRLLIQYCWKDDQNSISSVDIEDPNNKIASLLFVHALSGYSASYLAFAEVSISGTSITFSRNGQVSLNNGNNPSTASGNSIRITKVVGLN